ncbi:Crp/Fnr family transcriptional regulator [Pukyongiella litopenaei]|nr:Crp/Fnr family transcriptional regulator [Pukyongiella litopenaei]
MTWTAEQIADLFSIRDGRGAGITRETAEILRANGHIRRATKSQLITRRGDPEPHLCLILQGKIRLTAFTIEGTEILTTFLGRGESWGVHPCMGGYSETMDGVVESPTAETLMVRGSVLKELVWERRDLMEVILMILCDRLNLATQVLEQHGTWTARERLVWRLLSLAKAGSDQPLSGGRRELAISQESLAGLVRLSRQRTNKLLKLLEAEGAISLKYGRITLESPELLEQELKFTH